MADVPKDLQNEIKHLEHIFTITTPQMKKITSHFTKELTKGLTVEGGSIVSSIPSFKNHNYTNKT